ncbi:helix-turn-helix domain-containing protein [Bradyrhizobium sp. AUGA SZCCT0176]|uniref:helix-turn-helix domain-containing protein n=1 Tax=unclassified Bradyrhizobium TaxID=2631580 RepID=UPI001BA9E557|nr:MULTISPECIES: helix-turn-helix domain-containing protein [unclassified Bradyrhizobium]MBR1225075.1 helix-turn-helix domain-containing protein [Bradyrhizobium sp. AUGA SZCCT0176]MBR1281585.1 helix-turn-helix domain-containing protein [Bradyrhizobium sp. AUGA SZCCT0177]
MDEIEKAPNMIPQGAIRLSEAFEDLYRHLTPDWRDLAERSVQWEEIPPDPQEESSLENPYPAVVVAADRAESIFRWALRDGDLRAYIHNIQTGVDLELDPREWAKSGEQVGINFDYTGSQMPGPDCSLNGMRQPVFLLREAFERWMAQTVGAGSLDSPGTLGRLSRDDTGRVLATRAFSVEDVMERTGLSKTKFYEEKDRGRLRARKCGTRTLILETDLDEFLNNLEEAPTGSS